MSTKLVPTIEEQEAIRRERYRKAAALIRKWAAEDPEYDERVGALLQLELEDSSLRCEDRDEPAD